MRFHISQSAVAVRRSSNAPNRRVRREPDDRGNILAEIDYRNLIELAHQHTRRCPRQMRKPQAAVVLIHRLIPAQNSAYFRMFDKDLPHLRVKTRLDVVIIVQDVHPLPRARSTHRVMAAVTLTCSATK